MIWGSADNGYTIVETMVFLVVTAALFASAMAAVSGRQASVQFTQGIRDAQSKMQEIINDVSTGYYPSNGDFACSAATGTTDRPTFTAVATPQGSSNECTFLGKSVHFTTNAADVGSGAVRYNILSIAARRVNAAGLEVQSLNEALPTAIAPTAVGGMAGISDKTSKQELQFGIKVTRITAPVMEIGRAHV